MNLILLYEDDLVTGSTYILKDHRAGHIINILKSKPGDFLLVGKINGLTANAEIMTIGSNEVIISIAEKINDLSAPSVDVKIICALPRPQTLKKVLNSAATFGVKKLIFINANRVEKSYFQSNLLTEENHLTYLYEGLSQGKYTRLPEVIFFNRFKSFWENEFDNYCDDNEIRMIAHPDESDNIYNLYSGSNQKYVICIGPEGGWIPYEVETILKKGFTSVTLGEPVLRVETALVSALAQLELSRLLKG